MNLLRRVEAAAIEDARHDPVDDAALADAERIVNDVRRGGEPALRAHAERLRDLAAGAPLTFDRATLERARDALPAAQVALLERTAARIAAFAHAQRDALREISIAVPGGNAGHSIAAVDSAGCYAPGGRHPLPSSVLMTAVTARTAGVGTVWVASPRPAPVTLAAAAIAGADGLLAVGGAQAIAALAFGAGPVPACAAVVGPGNRWVTAAKKLIAGHCAIDGLAGPSELVVLADHSADAADVAADLLAQAEHDPAARPILVTTAPALVARVETELARQLATLPTAEVARAALANGFVCAVNDLDAAVMLCDRLAPEHLQLQVAAPDALAGRLRHYGALFVGNASAEVLGDYGAGPNHVLPTGGTARWTGGLSVFTFLRVRTWLRLDDAAALAPDAAALARLEGLEAHARAAERRR